MFKMDLLLYFLVIAAKFLNLVIFDFLLVFLEAGPTNFLESPFLIEMKKKVGEIQCSKVRTQVCNKYKKNKVRQNNKMNSKINNKFNPTLKTNNLI
jgi:hypothetical protein